MSSDIANFIASTVYGISKPNNSDVCLTDPLRNSLRDIRLQTQRFGKDRDEQVAKATRALKGIEGARITRAGLASCQKRVEELAEGLARLKRDNDTSASRDLVDVIS